jgi:hypothetical protein
MNGWEAMEVRDDDNESWSRGFTRCSLHSTTHIIYYCSAIYVTWTDTSASGGSWVTDLKLPLEATTLKALAADIRVRRQFSF